MQGTGTAKAKSRQQPQRKSANSKQLHLPLQMYRDSYRDQSYCYQEHIQSWEKEQLDRNLRFTKTGPREILDTYNYRG